MSYFLLAALLVAGDQALKWFVRTHLALGQLVTLIPHVLGLTYVQNTGAAFSSFQNGTTILAVISGIASVVLAVALAKYRPRSRFARTCVAFMLVGAVGNFIDRCFIGFVTDMFQTLFMDFPVFNIADAFLVIGVIGFCLHILFGDFGKKGRRQK